MKIFRNIFLLLLLPFSTWGQNNITLSGILLDKIKDSSIVACNVDLLQTNDSILVAHTTSGDDGSFSLKNLALGEYVLRVFHLGYRPLVKNISLKTEKTSINIGKLYLEPDEFLLQEVVVEGKKPKIIIKNDTIECNVSSYCKKGENTVVKDLLKKIPGIEIHKNEKVFINGREIKRFLLDNKDFPLDDPQILKNLPIEMIEKLQVLNPEGGEATINLSLRPEAKKNIIGNVRLSTKINEDSTARHCCQVDAFVNRMKNENRYTIIFGQNKNEHENLHKPQNNIMVSSNQELSPNFSLNGNVCYNDLIEKNKTTSDSIPTQNISANFQLEYSPDTTTTLIISPNICYHKRGNSNNNDEKEKCKLGETLDFTHNFRKTGQKFNINMKNNIIYKETDWKRDEDHSVSASWEEPLGKNNLLQTLYDISYNTLDSGEKKLNNTLGLNFKTSKNKYNYTIGFNIDPFWSYVSLSDSLKPSETKLNPLIDFNYVLGTRKNLRINYKKETIQPSLSQLKENPDLEKIGHTDELGIRFNGTTKTQLTYSVDLKGSHLENNIVKQDSSSIYKNENSNNYSLNEMLNIPLSKKLFFNNNSSARISNIYYKDKELNQIKKEFENTSCIYYYSDLFDTNLNISINQKDEKSPVISVGNDITLNLPYQFILENNINYTPKGENSDHKLWGVAITKQLFNRQLGIGSLKLQASFDPQKKQQFSFMFNFTYRFAFFPHNSLSVKN